MTPHSMTASGLLSARRELLGGQMIVAMTGCVMVHLTILLAPARLLIQLLRMLIQGTHQTLTLLNIMMLTSSLMMFPKLSSNLNKMRLRNLSVKAMASRR